MLIFLRSVSEPDKSCHSYYTFLDNMISLNICDIKDGGFHTFPEV